MARIRGEIRHISMTTLEGCDVKIDNSLFGEHTYIVKYKNVQFTDEDAREHVYRKGKIIHGSLAKQVYLDDMEKFTLTPSARERQKVINLYVHHMHVCGFNPVKVCGAYYSVASPVVRRIIKKPVIMEN